MVRVYHGKSSMFGKETEELRAGSFVATDRGIAEYYAKIARGRYGGVPVVVTFDVPAIDVKKAKVTDTYTPKHGYPKGAKSLLFETKPSRQKTLAVDFIWGDIS